MNTTRNPYSPPEALVLDPVDQLDDAEPLIAYGRKVPTGNCTRWIGDTFELFFQRPWKWLGTILLLLLMLIAVALVPFLNTILWPVLSGGIAHALNVQRQTRDFTIGDALRGFGPKFLRLVIVGCVGVLTYPVMFLVFFLMTDTDTAMAALRLGQRVSAISPNYWSALAVSVVLFIPLACATYLAAPLIMIHGLSPVQAMKMSFFGCLKNIVPWILFGLLMALIILVSAIPLFLGLFITLPVGFMAFYSMYRDIFIDAS